MTVSVLLTTIDHTQEVTSGDGCMLATIAWLEYILPTKCEHRSLWSTAHCVTGLAGAASSRGGQSLLPGGRPCRQTLLGAGYGPSLTAVDHG